MVQVLQVKKYNSREMVEYGKKWDEWSKEGGYNSNNYPPQQAFFGFYTPQGQFRQTGYVAFEQNRAYWRPTKKEAIEAFNKVI